VDAPAPVRYDRLVRGLRRHTILSPLLCDLKSLPLNSVQAFLLTRIDGHLTLGEIAEVDGMTLAELFPHADRLLEVGAVSIVGEKQSARDAPRKSTPPRRDSKLLGRPRHAKTPPTRAPQPTRPPPSRRAAQTARPTSRAIDRARTPAGPRAAAIEQASTLDEAVVARILGFHARLSEVDHYALLTVERGAEKAAIKRAYFALAAEFHPDRHFGKDLGKAGAALQGIFTRLTEAHDTLVSRVRRAEYDASLPPEPAPSPPPPAPVAPPRAASRALPAQRVPTKRSTRKMKSVEPSASLPVGSPSTLGAPLGAAPSSAPKPPSTTPASPTLEPRVADPVARLQQPSASGPTTTRMSPQTEDALRRLYNAGKQEEVRRHVRVFVDAAEAAMSRDDVVTAANNYRLALQNHDDPRIRAKLSAIEGTSNDRIRERNVARARSAERGERWAEAATYFAQANAARPEASTAERAANALRMAGGDLRRAAQYAEQAVLTDPKSAAYRVTLGEICLQANLVKRAAGEAERALALDPNDPRAKALAEAAAKKR
jgi:curved DNA-binding protein CbpA